MGFVFCAFVTQDIAAQRFIGSVIAGANFSQIEGDNVHGYYKVGFNGGLGLTLPVNRKQTWQVSLEMLYSMKGSVKRLRHRNWGVLKPYSPSLSDVDWSVPMDSTVKCNIGLDYVQIPVMVHYEDTYSGCTFGLGFAWSRLVRAHEIYDGYTRTVTARSNTYKKSDWSIIADINIRLYKNLNLNLRFDYSLVPIREEKYYHVRTGEADPERPLHKYHNNVLSARLVYYINEKFYRNTRVNKYGQVMGTKWLREIPNLKDE
jgi:hypothetical protein